MKAVILAGGEGTRLRPITYEIPKPLIPVQGRPVIEYSIDNYLAYGCEKMIIVISRSHQKHFEKWRSEYSQSRSISEEVLQFVYEDHPRGTFGAIAEARSLLGDDEIFFVGNADELKDINLDLLVKAHQFKNVLATIPLVQVDLELAKSLGNAELGDGDLVVDYVEKPEHPASPWVSIGGPYVMSKGVFDFYDSSKDKSSIERDLWEILPSKKQLQGYRHFGQYFGTDTLEKWERAIKEYKHNPPVYE